MAGPCSAPDAGYCSPFLEHSLWRWPAGQMRGTESRTSTGALQHSQTLAMVSSRARFITTSLLNQCIIICKFLEPARHESAIRLPQALFNCFEVVADRACNDCTGPT